MRTVTEELYCDGPLNPQINVLVNAFIFVFFKCPNFVLNTDSLSTLCCLTSLHWAAFGSKCSLICKRSAQSAILNETGLTAFFWDPHCSILKPLKQVSSQTRSQLFFEPGWPQQVWPACGSDTDAHSKDRLSSPLGLLVPCTVLHLSAASAAAVLYVPVDLFTGTRLTCFPCVVGTQCLYGDKQQSPHKVIFEIVKYLFCGDIPAMWGRLHPVGKFQSC